jgi:aryl-alcohol dehydrogenase-like predicted oxidoreductase
MPLVPNNQLTHPTLILGTAQLGMAYGINSGVKPDKLKALKMLEVASHSGINCLDTAEAYGSSDEVICEALRSGMNFKIYSKIKPSTKNIYNFIEQKLDQFKITNLEALSLHDDLSKYSAEQINELIEAKKNRLVKSIGISIYDAHEGEEASRQEFIDIIQCPYNLIDGWNERGFSLKKMKVMNKLIHVRSIYLQGLFFYEGNQSPRLLLNSKLNHIKKLALNWSGGLSQMAIDYIKSNYFIDAVIIGADNEKHIIENAKMWHRPMTISPYMGFHHLSPEEKKAIDPRTWKF